MSLLSLSHQPYSSALAMGCPPATLWLLRVTSCHQLEHDDSSLLRSWNCKQIFSQMLLLMSGRSSISGPWSTQNNPCICQKGIRCHLRCVASSWKQAGYREGKITDDCFHAGNLGKVTEAVLSITCPALLHSLYCLIRSKNF